MLNDGYISQRVRSIPICPPGHQHHWPTEDSTTMLSHSAVLVYDVTVTNRIPVFDINITLVLAI